MAPPGGILKRSQKTTTSRDVRKVVFVIPETADETYLDESFKKVEKLSRLLTTCRDISETVVGFQKKSMSAEDSISLLQEEANPGGDVMSPEIDPSQEVGGSQDENGKWQCSFCSVKYKGKAWLKKHMEKEHSVSMNASCESTLNESSFLPLKNSTADTEGEKDKDPGNLRKRKKGNGSESDDGDGPERRRYKLEKIEEGLEGKDESLDDVTEDEEEQTETQAGLSRAAEARKNIELFMRSFNDEEECLDSSLEEDKEKAIAELRRRLKEKTHLIYIKDGQLTERDLQIQDLFEERDVAVAELRKVEAENAKLVKEMDGIVARTEAINGKSKSSPSKQKLKEELAQVTESAETIEGAARKLEEELKAAKEEIVQLNRDVKSMLKLKSSLEEMTVEIDNVKEDVMRKEKIISQLKKKIPCSEEECTKGKKCSYAHHIVDRKRSRSRARTDKKHVPCGYFLKGHCKKTAESCSHGHFYPASRPVGERLGYNNGSDDSGASFNRIENQRFIGLGRTVNNQQNVSGSSVEVVGMVRRPDQQQSGANRFPDPVPVNSERSRPQNQGNEAGEEGMDWERVESRRERRRSVARDSGNGQGGPVRSQLRSPVREGVRENYSRGGYQNSNNRYNREDNRMSEREERQSRATSRYRSPRRENQWSSRSERTWRERSRSQREDRERRRFR